MTININEIAYASLADGKERLGIASNVSTWDAKITSLLITSSRKIDRDTGRRFWLDDAASARTYNPAGRVVRDDDGDKIFVDDIGDATGLTVEFGYQSSFSALASTAWEAWPDNAIVRGDPITAILLPLGALPYGFGRVRVTAVWGWPVVPEPIHEACLLQVARLFSRRESANGVAGTNDFGLIRVGRWDPDYGSLVENYELPGFA